MLQPFPSCQPKTCHDQISEADSGVCLLTGISMNFNRLKRLLRRLIVSYRICRLRSKNWLSKCVLPKADKAEAEGCQDPRQLFFSFPGKHVNLSCYLLSIRWLIILFWGSVECCFCCHNVALSTCTWHCGKLKSSNILQGSISRSARWQKTDAQPYSGVKFTGASFAPLTLHLRHVSRLALWGFVFLLDPFLARLAFAFLSHFCFLSQFVSICCPSWSLHVL